MGLWPLVVDTLDDVGQGINALFSGGIARLVVVIRPGVGDDEIGCWVFARVLGRGFVCGMPP